jgi:two-component system sensor histidine kinase/response regulator
LYDSRSDPALSDLPEEEIKRLCIDNLLASSEDVLFFKDRESRFLLVSAGWHAAARHGLRPEEALGKRDSDFFNKLQAGEALADERRVMETGESMVAKVEGETFVDGRPAEWASTTKLPLRDDRGNIVGTWGIARDITAQVEAEQALRASELQYRSLFEHNPQPMFAYDRDTLQIIAVSNSAVAAYGYTSEEFLAMTITDLAPADGIAGVAPADGVVGVDRPQSDGSTGAVRQRRHQYKDGTTIDVEVTGDDVMIDGSPCRLALCLNVTERNRVAAELAAARDAAVEASNMKSAFLANISHEIRTPMNGVIGMTELLLDGRLDDDERFLAEHVAQSGELMLELINDILDISKIEAGHVEIELTDFLLRQSIQHACALAAPRAQAKGLELDVEIDDALPEQVLGDSHRLRQVILNMVGNAVKFTSEGRVLLRATARPRDDNDTIVRIEVVDTGIGIESSKLEQIFEPFTQADVSTTRRYGGTGLGLAIARELTELMGGTIGVESEPGVGTTFWIELPLPASVAVNGQPSSVAGVSGTTNPQWLTEPLVLVAEDNPVNQIVAVRTLERCGCRAEVASDGVQALEMLSKHHYDGVLMDCQMPVMDGYQATTELRRREDGGHHTPVIAMTAHAMSDAAEKCLAAGMDDYISKPLRRAELTDTLHRWIPTQTDVVAADAAAGIV